MQYKKWMESAADFVNHIFLSPHHLPYPYHNLNHTKAVVAHANELALFYKLNGSDSCALEIAAWFHDIGQLYGEMEGHEHRSVLIMENYISAAAISPEVISLIEGCIMATRSGAVPQTLPEKIICDADTWHFGTDFFKQTEFLVKEEMEQRTGHGFPNWHQQSLRLLKEHVYYTEYCQLLLNKGKEKNIAWLQSLL